MTDPKALVERLEQLAAHQDASQHSRYHGGSSAIEGYSGEGRTMREAATEITRLQAEVEQWKCNNEENKLIAEENSRRADDAETKNEHLQAELDEAVGENKRLADALKEISKGDGAFNRDPAVHASNCIHGMKATAIEALAKQAKP